MKKPRTNSIGIEYLNEYINMNKTLTLFSYLLTLCRIVLIFLSIFLVDELIPLGFNVMEISPVYTFLSLLLAVLASYSAGQVIFYPTAALLILLTISWILMVIMLFFGIGSKKARKGLFTLSILTAIPDLLLLSGIVFRGITTHNQILSDFIPGIAIALCCIVINAICLRNNSEA